MTARVVVMLLTVTASLAAQSSRELLQAGNEAYSSGEFEQALDAYRQAQIKLPSDALTSFNEGAALFRQDDFAGAADAFRSATESAKASADSQLEAKGLFNLGNALLQNAENSQGHDPQTALESVRQGAAAYRQALDINPAMTAAAENLQIARSRTRALLAQQEQPQQSQSDSSDPDDLQQQVQEQLEQQQDLSKETSDSESEQYQQQQAERQRELQQRSEELAEQAQRESKREEAQEQLQQAAEEQQRASEQLEQGRPGEAQESQQRAEQHLSQALEQMESDAEGNQQAEQQPQESPSQEQPQSQQQQQPLQALEVSPEDILDQERSARDRRQALSNQQQNPVEKDW